MELKTAIEILEYHQEWRLGNREDIIHEPKKLTEALDIVISEVKKLPVQNVIPSVIYLVTNDDMMTVESAHWKLEDAKKEVDDCGKHQTQFIFMVVETEIH